MEPPPPWNAAEAGQSRADEGPTDATAAAAAAPASTFACMRSRTDATPRRMGSDDSVVAAEDDKEDEDDEDEDEDEEDAATPSTEADAECEGEAPETRAACRPSTPSSISSSTESRRAGTQDPAIPAWAPRLSSVSSRLARELVSSSASSCDDPLLPAGTVVPEDWLEGAAIEVDDVAEAEAEAEAGAGAGAGAEEAGSGAGAGAEELGSPGGRLEAEAPLPARRASWRRFASRKWARRRERVASAEMRTGSTGLCPATG
jgi:hypothetical protein